MSNLIHPFKQFSGEFPASSLLLSLFEIIAYNILIFLLLDCMKLG